MTDKNRARWLYRLRYAVRYPGRIPGHLRRTARDIVLGLRAHGDHVRYYRGVMKSDTRRNAEGAVGSQTHERWHALGRMQFEYLHEHGLRPSDRMLEIGCGNLRAGRLFIEYLDNGNYYGIDISPEILIEAQRVIVTYGLQDKLPRLTLVRDLRLEFLPEGYFTVVHAHSVFSHSPSHVIEECFTHVGRVLAPDGFFDFTYGRTEGREHHVLREDFYYRTETLIALAKKYDLEARFMADWEERPHRQSKIRITHPN